MHVYLCSLNYFSHMCICIIITVAADILHTTVVYVNDIVVLTCNTYGISGINGTLYPTLNWSIAGQSSGASHIFNDRININESVNIQSNTIVSTLTVQSVQLEDHGNYICRTLFRQRTVRLTVYDLIVGKLF